MRNDVRAKLIQVIEVEHFRGEDESHGLPPRWVKSYWDLKGNFLCESDPMMEQAGKSAVSTTEVYRQ